jgi:hypothetical protein
MNRACKDFKPFVTNKDICAHWITVASVPGPDGSMTVYPCVPYCSLKTDCPHLGHRPERLDQESDSEE